VRHPRPHDGWTEPWIVHDPHEHLNPARRYALLDGRDAIQRKQLTHFLRRKPAAATAEGVRHEQRRFLTMRIGEARDALSSGCALQRA